MPVHSQVMSHLRGFVGNRSGNVMILTALAVPVLFGFAGLGVDVGLWHAQKRAVQNAVDAGAVAGALEILRSSGSDAILLATTADAQSNGYDAAAGDVLTVNYPPLSGSRAGAGDAVEVILRRPAPSLLSVFHTADDAFVSARAVAVGDINDTCIWALDPDDRGAIKVAGGADVEIDCGIFVNSADPDGLTQSGTTSCLVATKVKVVGGASGDCIQPVPLTGVSPIEDPLASLQAPIYGSCEHTGRTRVGSGETVTLSPGVYCGNIDVVADGNLVFEPGVYILDGAGLKFSAQSVVAGAGVSFFLTSRSGNNGTLDIQAGADVTLSGATTGALPGVLFFHDRGSPRNVTHSLTGGATMDLEGLVYFPNQDLKFAGGTTFDMSSTMLVARTISFTGQSHVGDFGGTAVAANPLLFTVAIVE
jgi:Flp pilus assembly protein TadG